MNWTSVLAQAQQMARMVTSIVPLYMLTQWGVKLKGRDKPISFAELAAEFGIYIEEIVRIAGGFYRIPGIIVSPTEREAKVGWEQTALMVVPEDSFGVIALVVDTSTAGSPRFLVEFREESLAMQLVKHVVASASAVCSASNRDGAHGYSGNPTYISMLDNLTERARVVNYGDTARTIKQNSIIILEWMPKPGCALPDLSGKNYAWMTRREIDAALQQALPSEHLLTALAVYYVKVS